MCFNLVLNDTCIGFRYILDVRCIVSKGMMESKVFLIILVGNGIESIALCGFAQPVPSWQGGLV